MLVTKFAHHVSYDAGAPKAINAMFASVMTLHQLSKQKCT